MSTIQFVAFMAIEASLAITLMTYFTPWGALVTYMISASCTLIWNLELALLLTFAAILFVTDGAV